MDSNFVNNIIPRLRRFAQVIEVKEALVDKVWVIYGDADLIEYEFERSGEITITKNGDSYDVSWRIMGSGRLRIITNFANKSLAYDFSIHGILVMKIAGRQNSPFLLYDPKIVENGNLRKYLEQLENESKKLPDSNNDDKNRKLPEAVSDEEIWEKFGIFCLLIFLCAIIIYIFSQNRF